jgi:hypothetical protein
VSRAELVVEMSSEALRVLKSKIRHTEYEIAQISNNNKTVTVVSAANMSKEDEKIVLYADNSLPHLSVICQPVAEVVESDANFSSLSGMLAQMDVVCNASLRTFQSLLPEVQSRTFAQRRIVLLGILNKYSQLYQREGPSTEGESSEDLTQDPSKALKYSGDHADTDGIKSSTSTAGGGGGSAAAGRSIDSASDELCLKWEQYSAWYSERCYALLEIEKEFSSFIEDEREKEGRLLKKWFALSTPTASVSASPPFIKKSDHASGTGKSSGNTSGTGSSSISKSSSAKEICSASHSTSDLDSIRCTSPITSSGGTDSSTDRERDSVSCASPSSINSSTATVKDGQSSNSSNSSSSVFRADPSIGRASTVKPAPAPPSNGRAAEGRAGAVFCCIPPGSLHSPRSVTAFVEYFCSYYVSNPYGLGSNRVLGDALRALVEVRSCILWCLILLPTSPTAFYPAHFLYYCASLRNLLS